jgi:monoamine oxidase
MADAPTREADLVVVGAGLAGLTAARTAVAAGWSSRRAIASAAGC